MKRKGISLIVLIITIVVIIILATAIIVNLAQTNVIGNADEAVVKQDFKTLQEELDLYKADQYVDTLGKFEGDKLNADNSSITYTGKGTIKGKDINDVLPSLEKSKYKEFVKIVNGKIVIFGKVDEQIKQWAEESIGDVTEETITQIVEIDAEVTEENSTITGGKFAYNNPVIPVGFKAVNDGASWEDSDSDGAVDGWNDGLVIKDEIGNEFVWVPVDCQNVTYSRFNTGNGIPPIYTKSNFDAIPVREVAQVNNYGGFYIARYEAGVPTDSDGKPVSKPNIDVWSNITYETAVEKAESMYNTKDVISGMITGVQWDAISKWIESSNISVSDCTTWGNYSNSASPANVEGFGTKQKTGFSDKWSAKNIYDFAGNYWEMTAELNTTSNDSYVTRGGAAGTPGDQCAMMFRTGYSASSIADYAFRVVLYITTEPDVDNTYGKVSLNEIATKKSTINGNKPTYNNPVIPAGFKAVNDGADWNASTGWDNGLVIKDEAGNEFVWIPVDGKNVKYEKWCTDGYAYNYTGVSDLMDDIPVADEKTQVEKYGGFYIARYEAGTPSGVSGSSLGTPVSKKGANVWSDLTYYYATINAKSMYDNYNVKSGLLTGTQWDTVCKWLSNANIDVVNSNTWGNLYYAEAPANIEGYYRIKQNAGYSDHWSAKNLYDFAGNVAELTAEEVFPDYDGRFARGGNYNSGGSASHRYCRYVYEGNTMFGFRVVLYII